MPVLSNHSHLAQVQLELCKQFVLAAPYRSISRVIYDLRPAAVTLNGDLDPCYIDSAAPSRQAAECHHIEAAVAT